MSDEHDNRKRMIWSGTGLVLGAIALLLATLHVWAGPFSEPPSLDQRVGDKVAAVREAAIAVLRGEQRQPASRVAAVDYDRIAHVASAGLASMAVILAVVGFGRHERREVVTGAMLLGCMALAFQYLAIALLIVFLGLMVGGVIDTLDAGSSCCCDC